MSVICEDMVNLPNVFMLSMPVVYEEVDNQDISNNSVKKITLDDCHKIEYNGVVKYNNQHPVKIYMLNNLINKIKQSNGQFVNPIIFVDFIKRALNITDRIMLTQDILFKVKLWSNQLRQESSKEQPNNKLINYIGYTIANELINAYK